MLPMGSARSEDNLADIATFGEESVSVTSAIEGKGLRNNGGQTTRP